MPGWLLPTGFVVCGLAVWFAVAFRNTRSQIAATKARRPNPSRDEFIEMMASDCPEYVAVFLWETAMPYLAPHLTPHPDDDLLRDLPIDEDDWSMDWPRDFATQEGFHESNLPDWPKGWATTIRNYGRWLSMGPV